MEAIEASSRQCSITVVAAGWWGANDLTEAHTARVVGQESILKAHAVTRGSTEGATGCNEVDPFDIEAEPTTFVSAVRGGVCENRWQPWADDDAYHNSKPFAVPQLGHSLPTSAHSFYAPRGIVEGAYVASTTESSHWSCTHLGIVHSGPVVTTPSAAPLWEEHQDWWRQGCQINSVYSRPGYKSNFAVVPFSGLPVEVAGKHLCCIEGAPAPHDMPICDNCGKHLGMNAQQGTLDTIWRWTYHASREYSASNSGALSYQQADRFTPRPQTTRPAPVRAGAVPNR